MEPFAEGPIPMEEYSVLCRGCLSQSAGMKNIFEWGLDDDFFECTSLPMNFGPGMSELLCGSCEIKLQVCKQFRTQCHNSNLVLESAARKRQLEQVKHDKDSGENTISCIVQRDKLVMIITAPNMAAKVHLTCPYCKNTYIKQKDLKLHLSRIHHLSSRSFPIELQYYCSVDTCSYYVNSGRNKFFQGRKFLNQHYVKVHSDLKYTCKECKRPFVSEGAFNRHLETCNLTFACHICENEYSCRERLMVHLMRKHPDVHKQLKKERKELKRKSCTVTQAKRPKSETEKACTSVCDSPKRSFATQTKQEDNIRNDVQLPSWNTKPDNYETKTDEISTQTGFEDLLSLKSQASEDDSIFFSETVSLSDIQTQTFPLDFGLGRSNKETSTEMQSPDLSIKETQTCFCLYDSPKMNYKLFDSVASSPCSLNLATAETQTPENDRMTVKSDVLLSFSSAQTQTSFEEKEHDAF